MGRKSFTVLIFSFFIFHFSFAVATAGEEKVAAKVDGSAITSADVVTYIRERPPARGIETMKEAVEARLEEMITSEVLYNEALRLEMDRDPEIRQAVRQMLAQKLLNEKVMRPVWERTLTEEEIQQYYNNHITEFVQPERVRLADIFVAVSEDASSDVRDQKRKKAEEALADLQAKEGRFVFGEVMAEYSDTPANYAKGDTGFFDRNGSPIGLEEEVVDAAFGLSGNGEIYGGVIETGKGFHVIMLVGKRAATSRSLEDVKPQLEQRIKREELSQKRDAFIKALREKADVQIEKQNMEEIITELEKSSTGRQREDLMPPPLPGKMKN